MDCTIVNRRGKTMHLFVCPYPSSAASRANLRMKPAWEVVPASSPSSSPQHLSWSEGGWGFLSNSVNAEVPDGQVKTFALGDEGALLWLRGAALVGPWWLRDDGAGSAAVYRGFDARLVIAPGNGAGILIGLGGVLKRLSTTYSGRIRKPFVAPTSQGVGAGKALEPETALLTTAAGLVAGLSTMLAASGPQAGILGGALILSAGLAATLAGSSEDPEPSLDAEAIAERLQGMLDDRDASRVATTIATTVATLTQHRENFVEAVLRQATFTDADRAAYFQRWAGAPATPELRAAVELLVDKLIKMVRAAENGPATNTAPSGWPETGAYRSFLRDSLGTQADSFLWCMKHLAAIENRPILRKCLPEYLVGVAAYAVMAIELIEADVDDRQRSLTASLYEDVADAADAFVSAFEGAMAEIRAEMTQVISANGLATLPERIEVLRFYSSGFFGAPDTLYDPELPKVFIKGPVTSFGIAYPEYWAIPVYSPVYGPRIDQAVYYAKDAIKYFRKRATALQTLGQEGGVARVDNTDEAGASRG